MSGDNQAEVVAAARAFVACLAEPEPGLASWHILAGKCYETLRDAIAANEPPPVNFFRSFALAAVSQAEPATVTCKRLPYEVKDITAGDNWASIAFDTRTRVSWTAEPARPIGAGALVSISTSAAAISYAVISFEGLQIVLSTGAKP